MAKTNENVKPIILTFDGGEEYTLEFSRESVKFAEMKGFDIGDIESHPMIRIPELFFYAFRMHHRNVSRDKTDKILFEDLGGLSEEFLSRLGQLYAAPLETLTTRSDEPKNPKLTVTL